MFEFTEVIVIDEQAQRVWDVVSDVEGWWAASNPEHESLERLDDRGVEVGARLRIREKVAGIPGEAEGMITQVDPGRSVTWEAEAHYRWHGIPLTIDEGVTWTVDGEVGGDPSTLSATVWAIFPDGPVGRVMEWTFTRLLDGVEKDREHARTELRHLKKTIESESQNSSETA